jgi:hypothetical protein
LKCSIKIKLSGALFMPTRSARLGVGLNLAELRLEFDV